MAPKWAAAWLNADPIGLAGGLNVYEYAGNNPISLIDPLGLDAKITLAYTNSTFPGANHTYIIVTDTVTGAQYATRAGPEDKHLFAQSSSYTDPSFPDKPSETTSTQDVGTLPYPYDRVVAYTKAYVNQVNSYDFDYGPEHLNSNSYSSTYLDWVGLPKPAASGWTPGFDDPLQMNFSPLKKKKDCP
jgi:uncharacterized protein RhaS with RHS repeats